MVQESIITLALLHKFVYEFRGNNTYIIQGRTALAVSKKEMTETILVNVEGVAQNLQLG